MDKKENLLAFRLCKKAEEEDSYCDSLSILLLRIGPVLRLLINQIIKHVPGKDGLTQRQS